MKKILLAFCLMMAAKAYAQTVTPLQMASFVFQGIRFATADKPPPEIEMRGEGSGKTREEAVQNALIDAIQKGLGVLVVTDQTINGNTVVRNMAAMYSSGVVNSYEVISCRLNTCIVSAKISPWKFRRKLEGDSNVMRVNGNDLYASYSTANHGMIQRHKLTEYYFQRIRSSGLEVKIRELKITPASNGQAAVMLDYEVRFQKEFKKDLISFLERMEKDTNGRGEENNRVYIQWGPTGLFENRVFINAYDPNTRSMMLRYMHEPIEIYFSELNLCERYDVVDSVFTIDWYQFRKQKTIHINPLLLQNVSKISARIGC